MIKSLCILKYIGGKNLYLKFVSLANRVEFVDDKRKALISEKYGIEKGLQHTIEYYQKEGLL
jgi:hypothetical protein